MKDESNVSLDSNVEQTNVETKTEESSNIMSIKKHSSNKKNNGLIFIIVAIVVALSAFGVYKFVIASPMNIVRGTINTLYNKLEKQLVIIEKKEFNKISGNITVDTNFEGLDKLKEYNFDYSFGIDVKSKLIDASIGLNKDNNKLLGASAFIDNDNAYIFLDRLFDKYINVDNVIIDFDSLQLDDKLNTNKIISIIKDLKDIFLQEVLANKATTGKEKVTVGDKEYNLDYISMKYTKEDIKTRNTNMYNKIIANTSLLQNIADVMGVSTNEAKDLLKEELETLEYDENSNQEIIIYTHGLLNEVVGFKLLNNDVTNLDYMNVNKVGHFNIGEDIKVTFNDKVYKINTEDSNITLTVASFTNNKIDFDYEIESDTKVKGNFYYEENNGKGKMNLLVNMDKNNFSIKTTFNMEKATFKNNVDMNKVVKYDRLNNTDVSTILTNLTTQLADTIFMDLASLLQYMM